MANDLFQPAAGAKIMGVLSPIDGPVKAIFRKFSSEIGLGGMLILNYATKIAEMNDSDP